MIKLKFHLLSYKNYDWSNPEIDEKIEREYDENLTLGEVLQILLREYKSDKEHHTIELCPFPYTIWQDNFPGIDYSNLEDCKKPWDYNIYTLKVLHDQFNFDSYTLNACIDLGGKGEGVGFYDNLKFSIYPNEGSHNTPHIHVQYNKEKAMSVDLLKVKRIEGGFGKGKRKIEKKALKYIKHNQNGLLNCWEKIAKNKESCPFEMDFPF